MILRLFKILGIPLFFLYCNSVNAQVKLDLSGAVKLAKSYSLVLKTNKFEINAAEADIKTAGLRYNPLFNNQFLQLTNHHFLAKDKPFINATNNQVWYQLTERFYVKGQRHNKIDFAKKEYELSTQDYSDKERLYLLQVSDQWLEAWYLKFSLDITIQAQKNVDTLVHINRNRLKNQVISAAEATRTMILAQQYALQTKALKQQYVNSIRSLKLLLGNINDSLFIDVHKDDSLFAQQLPIIDTLVSRAFVARPDVAFARTLIKSTETNQRLQKSFAYPQPEAGFIWNPQNGIPYVGTFVTIPLPVFDRNQGQIQKSKVLNLQAQTSYSFKEMEVITELQNAYNSYLINKQNLEDYGNIIDESKDVLDKIKYSYVRGNTTFIDYLEAQRNLFETQKLYYETAFLYRQSYVRLLFASGLNYELEK